MTVTKNRQTKDTILRMAKAAFPDKRVSDIKELDDGFCNVTYDVSFDDGSESILKIAASGRSGNTSNEINLMGAEVEAMKLLSDNDPQCFGRKRSNACLAGKSFIAVTILPECS